MVAAIKNLHEKSAGQLVAFTFILSSILSIPAFILSPYLLTAIHAPSDIYPLALSYIRIIFLSVPLVFMGFAFNTIANSLGDTRTPTILNIVSSVVNMIIDPIFIFGYLGFPVLGVKGAAIATTLSRAIISFSGLYLLFHGYKDIKLTLDDLKLEKWWLSLVTRIGTPLAIQMSSNSLGFTIMMGIVSYFGSIAVAAYGVAIRILDVLQAFTWGVNRATSIMIGQNLGANYRDRAKRIAFIAQASIFIILSIGGILIIFRNVLVTIFVNDPSVINEGAILLSYFAIAMPFLGLFFTSSAIVNGSGHTHVFTLISILRLWVFRIGLGYIQGFQMGYGTIGIWIAISLSNILAEAIAFLWVKTDSWLKKVVTRPC